MKKLNDKKYRIAFLAGICLLLLAVTAGVNVSLNNKLKTEKKNEGVGKSYRYHIAMISECPTEEFWMSIYESAREEGKKNGVYIENFGEGLVEEYTTEELFEMAIAAKVDGIILKADGGKGLEEQIKKATKEEIPVMTILSDVPESQRISFVGGNDFATGELYGSEILEEAERKWNDLGRTIRVAVLVDSNSEQNTPNLIYSGIHEATASFGPRMELSASVIDNAGKFESEETVRDLLLDSRPPDILVCLSAVDTISAYQSVVDYNRVGQTSVIGYYSSEDTLEGIRKKIIKSSVLINALELGQTAARGMCEYLENAYVSEYLAVTPALITRDNVNEYMKKDK